MTRAAAYYRVSSAQQRDAGTIDSQRTSARALVASKGWNLVGEYSDDGHSARAGKLAKRTAFAELLDLVRAHGCDVVVLVAFDRLTRAVDLAELGSILGTLQAAGVKVVTGGGEETDLGTFGGRISALVRAQLAAEESEVKSDRARRGRHRTAELGMCPSPPPMGLHYDQATRTWGENEHAEVIREVFAACAGGKSCAAIANELHLRGVPTPRGGKWIAASTSRIIRTAAYDSGRWAASLGVVIEVPRLVDPDIAAEARARVAGYKLRGLRKTKHIYLLEGIASCARCGSPMMIHSGTNKRPNNKVYRYSYYVCERVRFKGRGQSCTLPRMRVEIIDANAWRFVEAQIRDPELAREAIAEVGGAATEIGRTALADLEGWRKKLSAATDLESEALRLRERGMLSVQALEVRLGELSRRRALLERQIASAVEISKGAAEEARQAATAEAAMAKLRLQCVGADLSMKREIVRVTCQAWQIGTDGLTTEFIAGRVAREVRVLAR